MKIPANVLENLGSYDEQVFDSWCGKPIGWGYRIVRHLGEEKFSEISKYGEPFCIYPSWFLITKWITLDELKSQYGEITSIERGPRGGFQSVTFGTTRFSSKKIGQLIPHE